MRKSPSQYEQHVRNVLAQRGPIGFGALRAATETTSDQALGRVLRRMRRNGTVIRDVIDNPDGAPRTEYRLPNREQPAAE